MVTVSSAAASAAASLGSASTAASGRASSNARRSTSIMAISGSLRAEPLDKANSAAGDPPLQPCRFHQMVRGAAYKNGSAAPSGRLGVGLVERLGDALLQAARLGGQLAVGDPQQIGVQPAIMLDGADGIHAEAHAHEMPEGIGQQRRLLQVGQ